MNAFVDALSAESLKVRKSKVFWLTALFFVIVASMMGVFMFGQRYPETSGKLGMMGDKGAMMSFGEPNWENYFKMLMQGIAGVGVVGVGFVASWIFGREFSDRTVKDLLSLPISREKIV